jgi:DNA invertase Pin-like site-specific DNA recombinase
MKAVLYRRVSTNAQGESGLGLASQTEAMRGHVKLKGWTIVEELEDIASGGSTKDRPGLERCLSLIEAKQADALVVAKLDRATRSVGDFSRLLDRLEKAGAAFVALDIGVDTSSPGGRLVSNVIAAVADWERATIGARIKDALRSKPNYAYSEDVRARARELKASGLTLERIAIRLEREGIKPLRGGDQLSRSAVAKMVAS